MREKVGLFEKCNKSLLREVEFSVESFSRGLVVRNSRGNIQAFSSLKDFLDSLVHELDTTSSNRKFFLEIKCYFKDSE